MATYLVKPNFNRLQRQLAFPSKSLNMFIETEIQDNFGFYQSTFGLYSYMTLNQKQKFVIHSLTGTPLIWQSHKSCAWDPTGSLSVGRREFEPCPAKINEEFCYDELFNSCFEPFMRWSGRGLIDLDADGIRMVNDLTRVLGQNATLGARGTLTAGKLFDPSKVEFKDTSKGKNIKQLFAQTAGTCKGWVELARELAEDPNLRHLNLSDLIDPEKFDGSKYTGDFIKDIFDPMMEEAPADLQALVNEGGIVGSVEGDFMPLVVVSLSFYNNLAQEYREQCNPANVALSCTNPRLSRREFEQQTSRGPKMVFVYYIDDLPVIPLTDLTMFDKYLTGTHHFAAVTASGNIGMGASFDNIPDLMGGDIGLVIEREGSIKEWGKYYFAAHSLFATTIADYDFMVSCQKYLAPAA